MLKHWQPIPISRYSTLYSIQEMRYYWTNKIWLIYATNESEENGGLLIHRLRSVFDIV